MTTVTPEFRKKVRVQMLGTDDNTVLSDEYVDQMTEDAIEATGLAESVSLRYYVVYLIALNWDSVGAIQSREGVTYVQPDPSKYLEMYNKSLSQTIESDAYVAKTVTNVGFSIDDNFKVVRNA
jgi:hypothetical protein